MPIWAAASSGDAIGSGILERSLSHGRRDADGETETGLMREPQGVQRVKLRNRGGNNQHGRDTRYGETSKVSSKVRRILLKMGEVDKRGRR